MDELCRADVDAPRRLRGDQQASPTGEFAGDDHLLLVAARERTGRDAHRARPNIEFLYGALREPQDGVAHNLEPVGEWRPFIAAQHQVVGNWKAEHQTVLLAVL